MSKSRQSFDEIIEERRQKYINQNRIDNSVKTDERPTFEDILSKRKTNTALRAYEMTKQEGYENPITQERIDAVNLIRQNNQNAMLSNTRQRNQEDLNNLPEGAFDYIEANKKTSKLNNVIYNLTKNNPTFETVNAIADMKRSNVSETLQSKYGMDKETADKYENNWNSISESKKANDFEVKKQDALKNIDEDQYNLLSQIGWSNEVLKHPHKWEATAPKQAKQYLSENTEKLKSIYGMTDEQIKEYTEYVSQDYNKKQYENEQQKMQDLVEKHPIIGKAALSGLSFATNFTGGFDAAVSTFENRNSDTPIDPYSKGYEGVNTSNLAKSTVEANIDSWLGKKIYLAAQSSAESLSYILTGGAVAEGLGLTGKAASTVAKIVSYKMFSESAFGSSFIDKKQQGLSDRQAIAYGISAGAAEAISEEIGFDNMFKVVSGKVGFKEFLNLLKKNAISEGLEEIASDAMNTIADKVINGDYSDYEMEVYSLMKDNPDMTEDEARKIATKNLFVGYLEDGFVGALSGLMFTGAGSAVNQVGFHNMAKNASDETVKNAADAAMKSDTAKGSTAREIAQKLADNNQTVDDLSTREKAQLFESLSQLQEEEIDNSINTALESRIENEDTLNKAKELFTEYRTTNMSDAQFEEKLVNEVAKNSEERNAILEARNEALTVNEESNPITNTLNAAQIDKQINIQNKAIQKEIEKQDKLANKQYAKFEKAVSSKEKYAAAKGVAAVTVKEGKEETASKVLKLATIKGSQNTKVVLEGGKTALLKDITFNDQNLGKLYNGLSSSIGNVNVANKALENYKGQEVESYIDAFRVVYNLGRESVRTNKDASWLLDNKLDSYIVYDMGGSQIAAEIFYLGKNDATEYKNTKEAVYGKPENISFRNRSNSEDLIKTESDLKNFLALLSDKTEAKIEMSSYLKDNNGNYVQAVVAAFADNIIYFTDSEDNNALQSVLHESMEKMRKANIEGYNLIVSEVLQYVQETKGSKYLIDVIQKYQRAYTQVEGYSPVEEVSEEYTNDFVAGILTSEEGLRDLAKWSTTNNSEKAKTLFENIKELFDIILNELRSYMNKNKHTMQQGARDGFEATGKRIEALRDTVLSELNKMGQQNGQTANEGNEKKSFSVNVDEQQKLINESMTMDQAKDMIQRAFKLAKISGYKNGDEWLNEEGIEEVTLVIENEYTIQELYLNKIPAYLDGDIYVEDILEAYINKTLTGKVKPKKNILVKNELVRQDIKVADDKFYSPQEIEDAKELLEIASQRLTKENKTEVTNARAKIILFAHDKNAAYTLGISESDLNKKLKSWSNYSATAKNISMRINQDAALQNRWTGIENSSYISKQNVTVAEVERMVKSIDGIATQRERNYIARTMLAFDTHIDWSNLSFDFRTYQEINKNNPEGRTNGFYTQSTDKITAKVDAPHTIAHEMTHALDSKWGRDFGTGMFLTNLVTNGTWQNKYEGEALLFLEEFADFVETLRDTSDIRSSYTGDIRETFARFGSKFVSWTNNIATGVNDFEVSFYNDKFTQAQYVHFARILQMKAALDNNGILTETKKFSVKVDSEGNNLSEKQIEYFKDSKAVDNDGKLLVLYHGTNKEFTEFKPKYARGWGKGVYLTDNLSNAKEYGNRIVKSYVNLVKPFDTRTMDYQKLGVENTKAVKEYMDKEDVNLDYIYEEEIGLFTEGLRELGYDGIISENSNDIEGFEIVAFYPEQVKLTSNTAPTNNPDIRYSVNVNGKDYDYLGDILGMQGHAQFMSEISTYPEEHFEKAANGDLIIPVNNMFVYAKVDNLDVGISSIIVLDSNDATQISNVGILINKYMEKGVLTYDQMRRIIERFIGKGSLRRLTNKDFGSDRRYDWQTKRGQSRSDSYHMEKQQNRKEFHFRNGEAKNLLKYKSEKQIDNLYFESINNNDMSFAAEIVKAFAEKQGYNTDAIYVYNTSDNKTVADTKDAIIYATDNYELAKDKLSANRDLSTFYSKTKSFYKINANNKPIDKLNLPAIISEYGKQIGKFKINPLASYSINDIAEIFKLTNNFDGIVISNVNDNGINADYYVFFNKNNIKAADTITYDNNGDAIPLSERFNDSINDIRFSVKVDDDLALFESIIAENEEFKEASNVITNTVKNIDNLKIKEADIKKIASGIKAEYKTNASIQDITDTLTKVFNYMNQDNVDYDSLVQIMSEVAKPMLENVTDTSTTRSESWDKFSSYLRNTKIKLSYGQIREVTSIYGSTENYRKKLFGVTTISREATMTLDEMWSELVDASGNLLPAYVADTDQPSVLLETIDSLRPQNIVSETYKMNLEQASFDLALEIYRRFFEAQAESNKSAELREAIGKLRTDQVVARRKAIEEYKRKLEEQKKLLEAEKQKNIKALAKELKDSEEKLIKAVEEHDQVSAALIESMKKKNERKIAQLKLQNNRKLAEVKSKNFDQRKAESDRRRSTILKEELRSQVNSINKMLKSPNISNYIKTTLVRQTIDVLESIDLDTGRSKNMSIKLMQLHDLYERYKGDETFSFDYDEATSKIIDNLRQTFENRNYTELSNKELTDVIDMVKRVKRQIQNAGKLLNEEKFKDARDAAQKAVTEIRQSRGTTNKFTEMLDDYMGYQLNAYRWFRKASGYDDNGALMQMYNSLDEGQMKMINMQKEVNSMFANVLEGEENQKNVRKIQSVEEKDLVNINLNKKGTPVMATREMMLSVLLHCQNADNARHIVLNGFRVPDLELYKKGKLEKAYEKGELKKFFTYEDISSIRDSLKQNNKDATFDDAVNWLIKWMQARAEKYRKENLSEWEEQYLQTAENLFHNYLGAKVNEVSQQTRGYALAKVVNYFPIHTDSDFTRTEFAALKNDGTLEGMGFLKERVKASNPIYLESLSNVIMKQTNDTSRYYGFSIPVRNINMIMGISLRNGEQLDSVRYAVTKVWGKTYLKIFQNILQDIQTGRGSDEGLAQTFTTMRGNFAAATLTANIGVGIKQAASFPTAAAVLGKEPLLKAFKDIPKGITAKGIPELEEINPLLWYRSKGQSSADINYATQSDVYKWLDKNHPKLKALSVDLIQNIDSATVRTLEYASMYYVDMNFKEIEKGSDKYWAKVSEVFTKVVEETQPNYTVLQRPEILKDKNALVRQLFMFKTQPMQNLGILYDALGEYLNVKKHYKKDDKVYKDAAEKLGRAIWSQLIAAATFSAQTILSNLVYHKLYKYDQDDDKSMIEEMALAFVTGITSTLSGILLGGDWLYSAIMEWIFDQKNYGIEVSVVEMINDVFSTVTNMIKYTGKLADAKTEAERETAVKNIAKNTDSAAVLVGEFFGIPINNVINSIGAILLPIKDLYTGAAWGESKFIWDESSDSQYLRMYDALLSNDSERYNKLYDEQKDKLSSDNAKKENPNPDYDPTDTINKKIKSMIKEAYTEKEITSDQAINYLDRAGISYNDDIIDEWDYKNETGAKSYSKYSRMNDAIKNSYENKADRSAINTEIKKLLKNGTDKSDIASTITRNYKSIYLNNKSADLKNLLISCYMSCGYTREEALKRINDWK